MTMNMSAKIVMLAEPIVTVVELLTVLMLVRQQIHLWTTHTKQAIAALMYVLQSYHHH
jgi:uncharacterized protein with PQ loop repeat